MEKGIVSVIIPIYNCEKYINNCVEMLLGQTYKHLEIILVNDGSKDGSGKICQDLENRYSNIVYIEQNNQGAASARNNGLKHSTGEYIMFVDADDGVKNTIIEVLLDEMDEDTDIVCCAYEILGSSTKEAMFNKPFKALSMKEKEPLFLQLMDYTYGHAQNSATAIGVPWAKLFRRRFLSENNICFDLGLRRMQDNVFVMEAFVCARAIKYIQEYLYLYRVDHISSYKKSGLKPEIYLKVLHARRSLFEKYRELNTKENLDYFALEHLNYLMMSVHNISVSDVDYKSKIQSIKSLFNDEEYVTGLIPLNTIPLSLKQKVQLSLFKCKMAHAIYFLYRMKYGREAND